MGRVCTADRRAQGVHAGVMRPGLERELRLRRVAPSGELGPAVHPPPENHRAGRALVLLLDGTLITRPVVGRPDNPSAKLFVDRRVRGEGQSGSVLERAGDVESKPADHERLVGSAGIVAEPTNGEVSPGNGGHVEAP